MSNKDIIWQYQDAIREIYKSEILQCLRNEDNSTLLSWHNITTRKCRVKYGYNTEQNLNNLLLCSDEIMHFTAQLYLYKPYLNNSLQMALTSQNITTYPDKENLEHKYYYMYSDVICEKLYAFWHNLADLIASFFPNLIDRNEINFDTAINMIPSEYHHLGSYKWLKKFKENQYIEINRKRLEVVHYLSENTYKQDSYIKSDKQRQELILRQMSYGNTLARVLDLKSIKQEFEKADNERNERPDFFKKHIDLSIEGVYQTLLMLDEVDYRLFADIP